MRNNSYEGNDCITEQDIELPAVIIFVKWVCVDGCVFFLYVNGDLATTENEKGDFIDSPKTTLHSYIYSFQALCSVSG